MELKITPKGLACLAMKKASLVHSIDDLRCDLFWDVFCQYLNGHGYSMPGIPDPDMALRIAQLEAELDKYKATGLTLKEMQFFTSPKMSEILKRIVAIVEREDR